MNSYICKKVGQFEDNNYDDKHEDDMLNTDLNNTLFEKPFIDEKNKLITLCIFSKIVYKYKELEYVDSLVKNWNIKYLINKLDDIVYGIFYNDEDIVISFKGTTNLKDTLSDIDFIQVDDLYSIPGKFHKGFHDLIFEDKVAESLELEINNIISKSSHKNLYITGHSLGGALATLFYSYLQNSPLSDKGKLDKDINVQLITYGCPRIGNSDFSNSIKKDTIRVVNGNDIVTKVPIFCYNHYEKLYHIGSKYSFKFISDHSLNNYYKELTK